MGSLKKFLREYYSNPEHKFIWRMYANYILARNERNSHMSYAEIENLISRKYQKIFGRKMDWDHPQTYNEKINVSKIYMLTPEKTRLADKILFRDWITEKIGSEYLIPLLGVYDDFSEIDFDALPSQFVIKCSHDSGSVTLIKDKSKVNMKALRNNYNFFIKRNYAWCGFEMHYKDIKPKIIIEKYMGDDILDYKFVCFDSKPYYCWVDIDRFTNHTRNFYNLDWELQAFSLNYLSNQKNAEHPEKFDEMKKIVGELCKGFPHVRVDLYFIDGKIYFGEFTFTSESGFAKFVPDEWDYKFGALWPFDNSVRKKVLAEHSRP